MSQPLENLRIAVAGSDEARRRLGQVIYQLGGLWAGPADDKNPGIDLVVCAEGFRSGHLKRAQHLSCPFVRDAWLSACTIEHGRAPLETFAIAIHGAAAQARLEQESTVPKPMEQADGSRFLAGYRFSFVRKAAEGTLPGLVTAAGGEWVRDEHTADFIIMSLASASDRSQYFKVPETAARLRTTIWVESCCESRLLFQAGDSEAYQPLPEPLPAYNLIVYLPPATSLEVLGLLHALGMKISKAWQQGVDWVVAPLTDAQAEEATRWDVQVIDQAHLEKLVGDLRARAHTPLRAVGSVASAYTIPQRRPSNTAAQVHDDEQQLGAARSSNALQDTTRRRREMRRQRTARHSRPGLTARPQPRDYEEMGNDTYMSAIVSESMSQRGVVYVDEDSLAARLELEKLCGYE
ncbi:hypothetical protein MKEN_00686300 [Mycena kentingensis (nom. inval.)]|nr:hypothetical protein MKEN_00686300 [Mycena kentingensis (nom. inval.)]